MSNRYFVRGAAGALMIAFVIVQPATAQHAARPSFFNERLACPSANKITQAGTEYAHFHENGFDRSWEQHYGFDKSKNPATATLAGTEAGREALKNYYDKANEMAGGCHPCLPIIQPPRLVVGATTPLQEVVAVGVLQCVPGKH